MIPTLARLPEDMRDLIAMPRPQWIDSAWGQALGWVCIAVACYLAAKSLVSLARYVRTRVQPTLIYLRIAGQLGLGLRDRVLLWRVARRHRLASPLTLLISKDTLAHYAAQTDGRYGKRAMGLVGQL